MPVAEAVTNPHRAARAELDSLSKRIQALIDADPDCRRFAQREPLWVRHSELLAQLSA